MNELELALEDSLQRLATGRSGVDQCLALYPAQAEELRPLLETAVRFRQAKTVRPSAEMRQRVRAKLRNHIQAESMQPRVVVRRLPRLAFAAVGVALSVTMVTTAFAQAALPGQTLYPLKLSSENIWRAAAPNPIAVDITLADRRADELLTLADQHTTTPNGRSSEAQAETTGIAAYNDVLARLANETNGPDATEILSMLQAHQQKLSHAGINVPELDKLVDHGNSQGGQGQGPKP